MRTIKGTYGEILVTKVTVDKPSKIFEKLGDRVQIVNVPCWKHAVFGTILALKSFERGTNHARTLKGEILLRLAGTLQIKEAIEKVGAREGQNYLVAINLTPGEVRALMEELDLREVPMEDCNPESLRDYFELSAMVEVL
ncbi:KEOPS complex subunit Cgi121 [Palaeococcus ferrophilus]|uniref:KEOPS complex subunit Cgi121 n=1 Tax=Palaeococcus ferrophilus TaxID=83868 RepID=UPI00064EEA42|nr:KEOPS complex subunit Cgi121 [Palaeococcus ferrophilus]